MAEASSPLPQQLQRLFESLSSHPYESPQENECRAVIQMARSLRNSLLNPAQEVIPFLDSFAALSYQVLSVYRFRLNDKPDRIMEESFVDCLDLFISYMVYRVGVNSQNSFLTLLENVRLLADMCVLNAPYGKNEITSIYRQLLSSPVPNLSSLSALTGSEEEKRDLKKGAPATPLAAIKELMTPITKIDSDASVHSSLGKTRTLKFSEKFARTLQRKLKEKRVGDIIADILPKIPTISAFMETDNSYQSLFKAVVTRVADAKAVLSKLDLLSPDIEVALQLSRIPIVDCCSPANLEVTGNFAVCCVANACKILTALNTLESNAAVADADGTLTTMVAEYKPQAMKRVEILLTIYERLEKSVGSHDGEMSKNISLLAVRYLLASIDGISMAASENDSAVGSAGVFLIPFFLDSLDKLVSGLDEGSTSLDKSIATISLTQQITPLSRLAFLFKHHDLFGIVFRLIAMCHSQIFSALKAASTAKKPAEVSFFRERSSSGATPREVARSESVSHSQDDLLLGCLWEELNADPVLSTVSRSSACPPGSNLTESILETSIRCLSVTHKSFFSDEKSYQESLVQEFLLPKHMANLIPLMTNKSLELIPLETRGNLLGICLRYESELDLLFHNMISSGLVSDDSALHLLKTIGLDMSPAKKNEPWPLYMPRTLLGFFGRLLLKWQFEQGDELTEPTRQPPSISNATSTAWSRFCVAIQQKAQGEGDESSKGFWKGYLAFEDINPEHMYLLIVAFHGLQLMQKKAVLLQVSSAFVSVMCKVKEWDVKNLLMVSRLLLIISYMMHSLYEPQEVLLTQLESLIFPAVAGTRLDVRPAVPVYEVAQKALNRLALPTDRFQALYHIISPDQVHADPLTLDGLACSFLLAPNKLPEYADFYEGLINLWNYLHGAKLKKSDDLRLFATYNYTGMLAWRLLRVLPPTLSHWEMFRKDSVEIPLDSVQNITGALWTTRIAVRNFKTWLKDTFVKLGIPALNADIFLGNCSDTAGFSKDLARLDNFMSKYLASCKNVPFHKSNQDEIIAIDASPSEESPPSSSATKSWIVVDSVYNEEQPPLSQSLSLVALVCKVQMDIDENMGDSKSDRSRLRNSVRNLLPKVLACAVQYGRYTVSKLLTQVNEQLKGGANIFDIYRRLVSVSGQPSNSAVSKANHFTESVPSLLSSVLADWQLKESSNTPAFQSWKKEYQHNEAMTFDQFVNNLITNHLVATTSVRIGNASELSRSLKYSLHILLNFIQQLTSLLSAEADDELKNLFRSSLLPVAMGCFPPEETRLASDILEKVLGEASFEILCMRHLLSTSYDVLRLLRTDDVSVDLNPSSMALKCIETMHSVIDLRPGWLAFEQLSAEKLIDVGEIMLSITRSQFSSAYDSAVLKLLDAILSNIIRSSDEDGLFPIQPFGRIEQRSPEVVRAWMDKVLRKSAWSDAGSQKTFLEKWITYVQIGHSTQSQHLAAVTLKAMCAVASPTMGVSGSDYISFAELMQMMESLASSVDGGHVILLTAVVGWMKSSIHYLSEREAYEKLSSGATGASLEQVLKSIDCLICYVQGILWILRPESKNTAVQEIDDLDLEADHDDDTSSLRDDASDDDVDAFKLCTYTVTSKQFQDQHWYHCHTCGLTNRQGMCTVCAKVCHKDHDVTYSKFGSFFCDCGAREDGSCKSLRRRINMAATDSSIAAPESRYKSSRVASQIDRDSGGREKELEFFEEGVATFEQINAERQAVRDLLSQSQVTQLLVSLMDLLSNGVKGVVKKAHTQDGQSRALEERFSSLRSNVLSAGGTVSVDASDKLLQPILATQEGTFDSVKNNSGEYSEPSGRSSANQNHGRKCIMCVFEHGSVKYLAVALEKSKITIFQLSHLLKQVSNRQLLSSANTSAPKLMLPAVGNFSCPFTINSIVSNPCQDGLMAVVGSKDCAVYILNPESQIHECIQIGIYQESTAKAPGGFIVKAQWLPDSLTQLLIATQENIKIYDLSENPAAPKYQLLIANGRIRDVTVAVMDGKTLVLAMSSSGQVFVQQLTGDICADGGPFFVTSVLNIAHQEHPKNAAMEEGSTPGGGVALYYSHAFQLLLLSYDQGKVLVAPLSDDISKASVIRATLLSFGKVKGEFVHGSPIWYFSEHVGMPGSICAWLQGSSVPFIMAISADGIQMQLFKSMSSKSKILDMVVTRSHGIEDVYSMFISMADDGTLKFFSLATEVTNAWLPAPISAPVIAVNQKEVVKAKTKKDGSGKLSFPVDFFEDTSVLNNVELGGDLTDIYPKSKLKSRLEQNGLFIVSDRTNGFTITITNLDPNFVICGFRVGVGSQGGIEKIPPFVKFLDRTVPFVTQRARTFDVPMTEEESMICEGKLSLFFGACENGSMTYLDSLIIHGKPKSMMSLNEDEAAGTSEASRPSTATSKSSAAMELVDKVTGKTLRSLEYAIKLWPPENDALKNHLLDKCIDLIGCCQSLRSTSFGVESLLFALLDYKKNAFHTAKDEALVGQSLRKLEDLYEKMATLRSFSGAELLDVLTNMRPVASRRPSSFYRQIIEYSDQTKIFVETDLSSSKAGAFIEALAKVLYSTQLLKRKPHSGALSVLDMQQNIPVDVTVQAVVEIAHALMTEDFSLIPIVMELYDKLISAEDLSVALAAKNSVLRTLRLRSSGESRGSTDSSKAAEPVSKASSEPQSGVNPFGTVQDVSEPSTQRMERNEAEQMNEEVQQPAVINVGEMLGDLQMVWQMVGPHLDQGQLEELIENPESIHELELPPEVDEEVMMDLAMALNLQPEDIAQEHASSVGVASIQPQVGEESETSNTDVEENVSDDEASNEGPSQPSGRRPPSPAKTQRSQDSEDGSGKSSVAGDSVPSAAEIRKADLAAAVVRNIEKANNGSDDVIRRIRRAVIDRLRGTMEHLSDGLAALPTLQVLFNLATDLLPDRYDTEKYLIDKLLASLLARLGVENYAQPHAASRSPENELSILLIRLLSLMVSRSASRHKKYGSSIPIPSSFTKHCASILNSSKAVDFCHGVLKEILENGKAEAGAQRKPKLLRPKPIPIGADLSPFFQKSYVRSCGHDLFNEYEALMTETALRLPYQLKKVADAEKLVRPPTFDSSWSNTLCEFILFGPPNVDRRTPRKLLMVLCGSKEKYRQVRDIHSFDCHLKEIKKTCGLAKGASVEKLNVDLNYTQLTSVVEHLKECADIAAARVTNWQRYCQKERGILAFLIRLAVTSNEPLAATVFQLLMAVFQTEKPTTGTAEDSFAARSIVGHFNQSLDETLMQKFVTTFLLESNWHPTRWVAHNFFLAYHRNSDAKYQDSFVRSLWKLFESLPKYGSKAAEFVDLLGYLTVKSPYLSETDWRNIVLSVIALLKTQSQAINEHPYSRLYQQLSGITNLEGYYLESPDPCLVCNSPDAPSQMMKLSAIKADAKYTSSSLLYKLNGAYLIEKIHLKISELKRAKMIKSMSVYYSELVVDNIVELKNNISAWKKAKTIPLTAGQTEAKMDFLLPIMASCLMIEFSEFFETPQNTQENVQCPRCSTMVACQPGICGNCGENVFQCLKCRSINYEDREPFLCHSCGFCKYGKFDFTITCRPSSSGNLDPVTNEEQRKRTMTIIDQLLTKCDSQSRTLQAHRGAIENLCQTLHENDHETFMTSKTSEATAAVATLAVPSAALATSSSVNPVIQAITYRYSVECKSIVQSMVVNIQKISLCRKHLRAYDRKQSRTMVDFDLPSGAAVESRRTSCFGCSTAACQYAIRLLRVIAKVKNQHYFNSYPGLVIELITNHLHRGNNEQRAEVKRLINTLMQSSQSSAVESIGILEERLMNFQKLNMTNPAIAASIKKEVSLLELDDGGEPDRHWELKVRCAVKLFLNVVLSDSPGVIEGIALPCLRIITNALKADLKAQNVEALSGLQLWNQDSAVKVVRWLKGDVRNSFNAWVNRCPKKMTQGKNAQEIRAVYLMQKYGIRWRDKVRHVGDNHQLKLSETSWLKRLVFYPGCQQIRAVAIELLDHLLKSPSRRFYADQFLGELVCDVGKAGEPAAEFVNLLRQELDVDCAFILIASPGFLTKLTGQITDEIEKLSRMEDVSVSGGLAQGYALNYLVAILRTVLNHEDIKSKNREALIGPVFNGYLALRKLVSQRTKQVNEAEERLLEIMENMTSGTEAEIKSFMNTCLDSLRRCGIKDYRTPQFIYERLCTIIFPEGKDKLEFSVILEKDPQQEDFIQGRMQGNPYPLAAFVPRDAAAASDRPVVMRDIKNKVCRDSELVALLEDDTGLELLVAGKIISLDLPVKDVYKRVWLRDNPEGSPMRVLYRLRGLMGDATEEFIENFDLRGQNGADLEETYKLAGILSEGGFAVVISHLAELANGPVPDQASSLVEVILKLLSYAVNLKSNRQTLIIRAADWKPFDAFVSLLKNTVTARPGHAHQLVTIMETVFKEAISNLSVESYKQFVSHCGSVDDVRELLAMQSQFEIGSRQAEELLHVIPYLCFCDEQKMRILVGHFEKSLNFDALETETGMGENQDQIERLCRMLEQLGQDEVSSSLRELFLKEGITERIVSYLLKHSDVITNSSPESVEFKKCTGKAAMKYVLRLLTGLVRGHEATQVLLSRDSVPCIHRLEHISTPLSVLAENLMEVMKENAAVRKRIEQIRDNTRAEKKRLAMAMRARQLGAMGMAANEKGEILVTKPTVKGLEDLADDKGHHCCICREGYRFKPDKVLGIYTFTKRQMLEENESKSPKTYGFNTVTHFTCVHADCHQSAIKSSRDEWEKAALHNANTKCNAILPMWGPRVSESHFGQSMARFTQLVQDYTGIREVNYNLLIHDLKLSLLTFAEERSFSEFSRGGGRDSNLRLVPYMIHLALYSMINQRTVNKEKSALVAFLKTPKSTWRTQSRGTESPLYFTALHVLLMDRKQWIQNRLEILQRLLVYSHERRSIGSNEPQEYSVYKSSFVFFGMIDMLYGKMFHKVNGDPNWTEALAEYIRHNDVGLMESCDKILQAYEEELLPSSSAAETLDVLSLRDAVPDPHTFIQSAFAAEDPSSS